MVVSVWLVMVDAEALVVIGVVFVILVSVVLDSAWILVVVE